MKILLVEDEVRIAELIVRGFETAGHQVSHSLDGESAIERLAADCYDIMSAISCFPGSMVSMSFAKFVRQSWKQQ